MKNTPEKIYLVNHCEELMPGHEKQFDDDIEYIRKDISEQMIKDAVSESVERQMGLRTIGYTKEQVIEFGRMAFIAGHDAACDRIYNQEKRTYSQWLKQEKPFDSK